MTVLLGPADADHYRVTKGRYKDRWYIDPLPTDRIASATKASWPSVTTVKSGAAGMDWSYVTMKRVARALTDNPTLFDGLAYDEIYERLKTINKLGLTRAGDRGTQVHRWIERALRGEPMQQPFDDTNALQYLPAIQDFLDKYQPELVAAELVCINRDLHGVGYGGTADAIIRIDKETYWPDWKSRAADANHSAYPEEAGQVGAYSMADYYIADGPQRTPLPVDVTGGLIVSIKPDGVRIFPLDLDLAQRHWISMHAWWIARQEDRRTIGDPWPPRANGARSLDLHAAINQAGTEHELAQLWGMNKPLWTREHTLHAVQRKETITRKEA